MRRLLLAGLGGIAVLLGGSVLLVYRLTADEPDRPGRAPAPPGGARPGVIQPAPPPPPGLDRALQAVSPQSDALAFDRMADKAPPPPPPPPGSWEAVPVVTNRSRNKDPVAAVLGRELADLHDQLVACFDPAVASGAGSAVPSRVKDDVQDDAGATVLVLQVEARPGSARVVDAPAAADGGASDATLACVQALLRGKEFEDPRIRAGGRHRIAYSLIP